MDADTPPGDVAQLRALAPTAQVTDNWEALLDAGLADAVLVASGPEDLRAEPLRKLVQLGRPVLAAHPVFLSTLVYFELDMIRHDTGSVLLAYLPDLGNPAIAHARSVLAESAGPLQHVVFERFFVRPARQAVLDQFARDAVLLTQLCGEVTRLGAMGATADQAEYVALGVQMTGPEGLLVRWSAAPAEGDLAARLKLLAADRSATVEIWSQKPWSLELTVDGRTERPALAPWNAAGAALDELRDAIAGNSQQERRATRDWTPAARSVELAETVVRSLRKGRTLEVYREEHSEESTFKGTMAAAGCGLLMAGLLLLAIVALADDFARAAGFVIPLLRMWPYLIAVFLGIFLMMQLLTLVFRRKSTADDTDSPPPT